MNHEPAESNNHVDRILESLADSLEGGTEFLTSQAAPMAEQLVLMGRVYYTSATLLFLAGFVLLCGLVVAGFKSHVSNSRTEDCSGPIVFCGIAAALTCIPLFVHAYYMVMAWAAPNVYVLDYCKDFVS
jgi:hypothetical protein